MVRISDFFGGYGPEKERPSDNHEGKIEISNVVNKNPPLTESRDAAELHTALLSEARKVYRQEPVFEADFAANLNALADRIAVCLSGNSNKELLNICLLDYPRQDEYLYCHVVNVCIISVDIGIGLSYDKVHLCELGISAFLHDIGITQYLNIINKQEILSKEEYEKIKHHPKTGGEILAKINMEFCSGIYAAVIQEHERMDGSGYPAGLKDGEISEYAQIIGLVDVYEAMIHQRPYRSNYTPLETIKTILNDKGAFNSRIIKVLIERIGIFPVGISVRLNTKEVGIVIKENVRLPLRPVVNVTHDAYGKELKLPKQIDLAENSMVCIEDCIKRK